MIGPFHVTTFEAVSLPSGLLVSGCRCVQCKRRRLVFDVELIPIEASTIISSKPYLAILFLQAFAFSLYFRA